MQGLVWDYYPEGGGELLVALSVADKADHHGGRIWPGVELLAGMTRQSPRNVQRHLRAMQAKGWLLVVKKGGAGPRSTTRYRIPVAEIQRQAVGMGDKMSPIELRVPPEAEKGDTQGEKGDTAMSPDPSVEASIKKHPPLPGAGEPTPIALAARKYRENIKAAYGGDYPGSASLNGRLKNIIARVGAEQALKVIDYYFRAPVPFYKTVKHSVEILQRDCEKLWLDVQQLTAGAGEKVTSLRVELVKADGQVARTFTEPVTEAPYQCARRMRASYARMIDSHKVKTIRILAGRQAHPYSVEEIDADTRARA